MNTNIKQLQSEYGAVGEYSENAILFIELVNNLKIAFTHQHNTPSESDCILLIGAVGLGTPYKQGNTTVQLCGSMVEGCADNVINIICRAMKENEDMAQILLAATHKYLYDKI